MRNLTELRGVACRGSVEEMGGIRETSWRQSGAETGLQASLWMSSLLSLLIGDSPNKEQSTVFLFHAMI